MIELVEKFSERVEVTNAQDKVTIVLNGNDSEFQIKKNFPGQLSPYYIPGGYRNILNFKTDPETFTLYSHLKIAPPQGAGYIPMPFPYALDFNNQTRDFIINFEGKEVFKFWGSHAALYLGASGNDGNLIIKDHNGNERIHLDGETGDIKLTGADCAEEFDVSESEEIEPGMVLVIDDESKLRPCKEPYDKKVTGVVSGGNGSNPGIILDKNPAKNKRLPIALNGKVYCKVDAQFSPIEVGDLLTTSPTLGHAMKADDPLKAFGAVIGKALRSLEDGRGLIPILVALQ